MNHTKAGRKRSFRERCTGAARRKKLSALWARTRDALLGVGSTYVFKITAQ